MKKTILILVAILMMSGCSTDNTTKQDRYVFAMNDHEISVGDQVDDFLNALGEYNSQSSAPSCAFDGDDTVYDYPSYQLTTYYNNGTEILTGVYILDASVVTKEKIKIGSTLENVISTYGDDYVEEYGVITYTKGKTDLSFVIIDEVVTSISYIHVVE